MLTSHGMLKASLTFKFAFMIAACSSSIKLKIHIPYSKINSRTVYTIAKNPVPSVVNESSLELSRICSTCVNLLGTALLIASYHTFVVTCCSVTLPPLLSLSQA